MSIEVMNAVWRHSKSAGRQKLVLLAIADHQGELGAWPSIATLARMVNASERSVQRDIQELIASGELSVELRSAPTRHQHKSNRYWVTLAGPDEVTDSTILEVTDSRLEVTKSRLEVTPVGVINLNRNLIEKEHPQNEFEEAFLRFWSYYPRKVEKVDAKRAFVKATKTVTADILVEAAKRLASDPNLPPKQYVPYPASWLNAGGWESEPYPERQRSPEERKAVEMAEAQRRRERDLEASRKLREESEEARRRAIENPPEQCEHGRIKVICNKCPKPVLG